MVHLLPLVSPNDDNCTNNDSDDKERAQTDTYGEKPLVCRNKCYCYYDMKKS